MHNLLKGGHGNAQRVRKLPFENYESWNFSSEESCDTEIGEKVLDDKF